jgi:hypothetical protein
VWKLDRIARSMREGINILSRWCELGVRVVSITQQIDLSGTVGASCRRGALRDRRDRIAARKGAPSRRHCLGAATRGLQRPEAWSYQGKTAASQGTTRQGDDVARNRPSAQRE